MTQYFQLKFFTKSLTGEGLFERMAIMKCQFGEAASAESEILAITEDLDPRDLAAAVERDTLAAKAKRVMEIRLLAEERAP